MFALISEKNNKLIERKLVTQTIRIVEPKELTMGMGSIGYITVGNDFKTVVNVPRGGIRDSTYCLWIEPCEQTRLLYIDFVDEKNSNPNQLTVPEKITLVGGGVVAVTGVHLGYEAFSVEPLRNRARQQLSVNTVSRNQTPSNNTVSAENGNLDFNQDNPLAPDARAYVDQHGLRSHALPELQADERSEENPLVNDRQLYSSSNIADESNRSRASSQSTLLESWGSGIPLPDMPPSTNSVDSLQTVRSNGGSVAAIPATPSSTVSANSNRSRLSSIPEGRQVQSRQTRLASAPAKLEGNSENSSTGV